MRGFWCCQILHSKLPYSFKLLCDALSIKYPKLHETVANIRKTVHREGTKDAVGKRLKFL